MDPAESGQEEHSGVNASSATRLNNRHLGSNMSPTAHLQAADSYMQSQAVNLEIKSFENGLEPDTSQLGNQPNPYDLGTEIRIQQNRSIPPEAGLSGP